MVSLLYDIIDDALQAVAINISWPLSSQANTSPPDDFSIARIGSPQEITWQRPEHADGRSRGPLLRDFEQVSPMDVFVDQA